MKLRYLHFIQILLIILSTVLSSTLTFANKRTDQSTYPQSKDNSLKILTNSGYITGYSECKRSPLWVNYVLSKKRFKKWPKRRPAFKPDPRTNSHLTPDDYWLSGYDRGHLAPGYGIWTIAGKKARIETYLMSNIVPQSKKLNQKLWQRLEEVATTYFTRYFEKVNVYTGPIYITSTYLDSGVRVPDSLYKIFFGIKNNKIKVLSFIMPQQVSGKESLSHYVVSVNDVENATGLDFFSYLSNSEQSSFENNVNLKPWNLVNLSNLPGRY